MAIVMHLPNFPIVPTKQHQLIVVFGNGFAKNWDLPSHVIDRLDLADEYYRQGIAPIIALGGNKSMREPYTPIKEAQAMANYLHREKNIPLSALRLEITSENSRENVLYLKTGILIPERMTDLLVLCPDYQRERLEFLLPKILGPEYIWTVCETPTELGKNPEVLQSQRDVLDSEKRFFASMKDGDHTFLEKRLSVDPCTEINPVAAWVARGRKL